MRITVKLMIYSVVFLALCACRSTDDFQSGDYAGGDTDPALYFNRQTGSLYRTAVLTFSSAEGGIAFFDAFVTDEVIRRLSAAKNITLIERSRIALVIQEHELSLTGLGPGDNAARLGKLLAADRLVTGTYAYRNETIRVRGRVLDAVTGKIESTFAFIIPYRGKGTKTAVGDDVKTDKGCDGIQRPVLLALRDLTTPPAVNRAVERAVAVPWKKPCGRIHMKVMTEFARAGLYPRRYHEFLVRTLEAMEDPREEYYTVREIFYYFARDGVITEFEWAAAREVLKKAWHPFHLKFLFNPDRYSDVVIRRRVTELLDLARKKEIGRPYAYTEYRIGEDLLTTPFIRNSEKGIAYSLFILRSLRDPAGATPKEALVFFRIMTNCYEDTLTPAYRKEALEMLISFLKPRPPDREYADLLWYFLHRVDEKMREKRKPYVPYLSYEPADLKKINNELRDHLCSKRKTAAGTYHEKEVNDYMVRYGVRCAGAR